MPQAAAYAVTGFSSLAAAFASGAAAAAAYATVYVITAVAINYGLSRLSQSLAGKPKNQSSGAVRDVTVRGTVEPMQMIYGEVMAPGFIAMYATSGANNRYLHFVVVYAAHQCEDISDVWLDSLRVPDADIDGSGNVSTTEFQGEGASRLQVHRFLGTKGQAADTNLTAGTIGDWTSNHRGAGVAYIHYRLDGSDAAFPAGSPSNFRALVKGRRLYDPRLDSTNGGSGSHRYADARTWGYSNNAALCRRDYITGGSRWYDVATPEPRLGFGESNARINDTFTIAAANIDDELVAIPPASPATTQPRYTCDVQLSCGDTHKENLRILESANAGTTSYVNGQYRIYSGAYDTPDIDLDESDILGPVTVVTHPNGEDLYNLVTGTFYDEDRDWSLSPFPPVRNSSYETDDGGQKPRNIELHATRNTFRAQRIAILHLAQSRQKFTVRFERLSPKAMAIAENETFTVTISEFGWSSKVFRCIEWEWMPDGFIAITAREESSAAYADPSVATYTTGGGATVDTPEYDEPDAPINFTVTGDVKGVLLKWSATAPVKRDQTYHVYEHTAITPFSSATRVWSGKAFSTLINLTAGTTRYYWITSELNGIESAAVPVGNGTAGTPGTAVTADIADNAISQREFASAFGPITRTGNGTVIEISFTAAHAGELIINLTLHKDDNTSAGSYAEDIEVDDSTVSDPLTAVSVNVTGYGLSNESLIIVAARAAVAAGAVTVRWVVESWAATGSVAFSNCSIEAVLLKK